MMMLGLVLVMTMLEILALRDDDADGGSDDSGEESDHDKHVVDSSVAMVMLMAMTMTLMTI